jgi:hypothetical protein
LETLTRDVRLSARSLARRPAFTLTVLLTLGLGIGGTTAVFSVLNAVLLRPLPFAEGERLLRVRAGSLSADGDAQLYSMSDVEYLALHGETALFERVLAARPGSANLVGRGPAERVSSIGVSPGFWPALGVAPALGRHFSAEEERLWAASAMCWGAGSSSAIGRSRSSASCRRASPTPTARICGPRPASTRAPPAATP